MHTKSEFWVGTLVLALTLWVLFLSAEDFRADEFPAVLESPPMPAE